MAKTQKINAHSPLVTTGYVLFALLIVAVILSTVIPFGKMLFDPRVLHYNVALFTVALTIGALLPALLGYLIGGTSIRSKSKLSHHFNGVAFGLLAYWIMMIVSVFVSIPSEHLVTSPGVRAILVNLLPSIGVAVISTILAVAHVRSRQAKQDIIEFKPFSVVLVASIILLPVWSLINNILTQSVGWSSFVSLAITVVIGALSYATLHKSKLSPTNKIAWSAVSVSVAYVALFILSEFTIGVSYYVNATPTMEFQAIVSSVGWVLAFVVWSTYWYLQVKSLSKR